MRGATLQWLNPINQHSHCHGAANVSEACHTLSTLAGVARPLGTVAASCQVCSLHAVSPSLMSGSLCPACCGSRPFSTLPVFLKRPQEQLPTKKQSAAARTDSAAYRMDCRVLRGVVDGAVWVSAVCEALSLLGAQCEQHQLVTLHCHRHAQAGVADRVLYGQRVLEHRGGANVVTGVCSAVRQCASHRIASNELKDSWGSMQHASVWAPFSSTGSTSELCSTFLSPSLDGSLCATHTQNASLRMQVTKVVK